MGELKVKNHQDETLSLASDETARVVSEDLRFEGSPTLRALFRYRSKYENNELTVLTPSIAFRDFV